MLRRSSQTPWRSSRLSEGDRSSNVTPFTSSIKRKTQPSCSTQPKISGTGTRGMFRRRAHRHCPSAMVTLGGQPYLTRRPRSRNRTGGRSKSLTYLGCCTAPSARTSDGEGRLAPCPLREKYDESRKVTEGPEGEIWAIISQERVPFDCSGRARGGQGRGRHSTPTAGGG